MLSADYLLSCVKMQNIFGHSRDGHARQSPSCYHQVCHSSICSREVMWPKAAFSSSLSGLLPGRTTSRTWNPARHAAWASGKGEQNSCSLLTVFVIVIGCAGTMKHNVPRYVAMWNYVCTWMMVCSCFFSLHITCMHIWSWTSYDLFGYCAKYHYISFSFSKSYILKEGTLAQQPEAY